MATAVENGVSGYVDTDVDTLVGRMRDLLDDHALAARLSEGARRAAQRRFSIDRFAADWDAVLRRAAGEGGPSHAVSPDAGRLSRLAPGS